MFSFKLLIGALIILIYINPSFSQNKIQNNFRNAIIVYDDDGISPTEIRFKEGLRLPKQISLECTKPSLLI